MIIQTALTKGAYSAVNKPQVDTELVFNRWILLKDQGDSWNKEKEEKETSVIVNIV